VVEAVDNAGVIVASATATSEAAINAFVKPADGVVEAVQTQALAR
jgi:hypothetical protein